MIPKGFTTATSSKPFAIIEIRSEIRVVSMIANLSRRESEGVRTAVTLVSSATYYRHRQWVDVPLGSRVFTVVADGLRPRA